MLSFFLHLYIYCLKDELRPSERASAISGTEKHHACKMIPVCRTCRQAVQRLCARHNFASAVSSSRVGVSSGKNSSEQRRNIHSLRPQCLTTYPAPNQSTARHLFSSWSRAWISTSSSVHR